MNQPIINLTDTRTKDDRHLWDHLLAALNVDRPVSAHVAAAWEQAR